MQALIQEVAHSHSPESLATQVAGEPGLVLLHSGLRELAQARYSFVAVRPFITFRSAGSRCEITILDSGFKKPDSRSVLFGNPWLLLDELIGRYELLDEIDLPFPLGGCFGFWGYGLNTFVEPKLRCRAFNDLELPDCHVGFYDSLVLFDHHLNNTWIISTGLSADGSRRENHARRKIDFWQNHLQVNPPTCAPSAAPTLPCIQSPDSGIQSTLSPAEFIDRVERARRYICAGDIYQVNLSQRLAAPLRGSSWEFFRRLSAVSPAPFAAFLQCNEFQLASSSPELFLRLDGSRIITRPIKGTRPRAADADEDTRLAFELQTSPKENAELLMITDLLRNDLGRVCEFGSVHVPDLMRLERFAQVQHLVSTVEGRLRRDVTHLAALAACFPGGSVTGAPKFRAMEIIDDLEPTARGPFCGALGYLGFNRASQFGVIIRTAICKGGKAYFPVGAGIVADSQAEAEFSETVAKAAGFVAALARHDSREEVLTTSPLPPVDTADRKSKIDPFGGGC